MPQNEQLRQLAQDIADEPDWMLDTKDFREERAYYILGFMRGLRARARAILKNMPKDEKEIAQ